MEDQLSSIVQWRQGQTCRPSLTYAAFNALKRHLALFQHLVESAYYIYKAFSQSILLSVDSQFRTSLNIAFMFEWRCVNVVGRRMSPGRGILIVRMKTQHHQVIVPILFSCLLYCDQDIWHLTEQSEVRGYKIL